MSSLDIPVTGRHMRHVLAAHHMTEVDFEQLLPASRTPVVVDLGCGASTFGATLRAVNIEAVGVDLHPDATPDLVADITDTRLPSCYADVTIATYSLPFWATTEREVTGFFDEAMRITRVGGVVCAAPYFREATYLSYAETGLFDPTAPDVARVEELALETVARIHASGQGEVTVSGDALRIVVL